jgi:hypothetical protein
MRDPGDKFLAMESAALADLIRQTVVLADLGREEEGNDELDDLSIIAACLDVAIAYARTRGVPQEVVHTTIQHLWAQGTH